MKLLPLIFYFLYLIYPLTCFSQNKETNAQKLYVQGKFDEAIKIYESMLREDPQNPYLYYNIGNAYMKLNKIEYAIVYYLKAFNLLPRNSDIKHNLDFAIKRSGQKLIPEGVPTILYTAYYFFSFYELKALATIFFWLAMILFSIHILLYQKFNKEEINTSIVKLNRFIKKPAIMCTSIFIFILILLIARTTSPFLNAGVVIKPDTSLLSGPGENFTTYATIPIGRLVKILDSSGNYYEIGIPQERIKGWVLKNSIEKI